MKLPPDDRERAERAWRGARNSGFFVAVIIAAIAAPSFVDVASGHGSTEAREMLGSGLMVLVGLAAVVAMAFVITHWTAWRGR